MKSNVAEGKNKSLSWPKPVIILLGYAIIVSLALLSMAASRNPSPWGLILTAPILLSAFHYRRWVYLSMAALFLAETHLTILALHFNNTFPALEIVWATTLTMTAMAEITGRYASSQKKIEQSLRISEQSYRTLAVLSDRQNKELSLLDEVQTVLAREADPRKIYRAIVESVIQTFGYPRASIYSFDGKELVLQYQVGYSNLPPKTSPLHGIIGRVARTGQPILIKNEASKTGDQSSSQIPFSRISVPILDQQAVLGVLNVEGTPEMMLDEADLRTMKAVSVQAVIAINRARLHYQIRESEERFQNLVNNLGEGVATIDEKDRFLFANPAAELIFGVPHSMLIGRSISEFTSAGKIPHMLEPTYPQVAGKTGIYELEIERGDGEKRNLLITSTPQLDENGKVPRTLAVFHDFTDRKKMEVELRYLSTHDTLTGLYNRAYIETELARLESSRHYPISIFMIDVDGMKTINDRYGHSAGDDLLRRTASVLKSSFRSEDVVARFGGDEFTVLLPGAAQPVAQTVCDRLHANIELHNKGYNDIKLSLSIGVGTGDAGLPLSEVLKSADYQMYEEKLHHRLSDI